MVVMGGNLLKNWIKIRDYMVKKRWIRLVIIKDGMIRRKLEKMKRVVIKV